MACGYVSVRSRSGALGMTSFSTNCLTVEMISVWNSVRPIVSASLVMRRPSPQSAGDRFCIGQSRDVGCAQAQPRGEQVGGIAAESGRGFGCEIAIVEDGRHRRREIVAEPVLVQRRKQRIRGNPFVFSDLRESPVTLEQYAGGRQRLSDLRGGVVGEPDREQTAEHVAVSVALALVAEVGAERLGQR